MADLVIRDRNGEEVTYEGVEKVKFNTTDGGTQLYSEGDTVENIPIALDFSEGDQTVEAPSGYLVKSAVIAKPENLTPENIREGESVAGIEGTLPAYEILEDVPITLDFSNGDQTIEAAEGTMVKSATIQQPETLLPENIAEGVDIAGVIGTLATGSAVAYKYSSFTATGTWNESITVNFGFVPDFLLVYPQKTVSLGTSNFLFMGFSTKANTAIGSSGQNYFYLSSGTLYGSSNGTGIDATGSDSAYNCPLNSATENGFRFGKTHPSGNYYVHAFKLV